MVTISQGKRIILELVGENDGPWSLTLPFLYTYYTVSVGIYSDKQIK